MFVEWTRRFPLDAPSIKTRLLVVICTFMNVHEEFDQLSLAIHKWMQVTDWTTLDACMLSCTRIVRLFPQASCRNPWQMQRAVFSLCCHCLTSHNKSFASEMDKINTIISFLLEVIAALQPSVLQDRRQPRMYFPSFPSFPYLILLMMPQWSERPISVSEFIPPLSTAHCRMIISTPGPGIQRWKVSLRYAFSAAGLGDTPYKLVNSGWGVQEQVQADQKILPH